MKTKHKLHIVTYYLLFMLFIPSFLSAQKITTYKRGSGLVDNYVYALYESTIEDTILWSGTEQGLCRFDGIIWKDLTHYINSKVTAILQDFNGDLWIGTANGLYRYDNENWSFLGQTNIYLEKYITSLFIDSRLNLWVGTREYGILKRSVNGEWTAYNRGTPGLKSNYITTINEDYPGNILIGTRDEGVFQFDGQQWSLLPELKNFLGADINVIFKDNGDTLWLGSSQAVVRTHDGIDIKPCQISGNLDIPHVQAIAEDGEKNIWLGTENNGLYKYNRMECNSSPVQLPNNPAIWTMMRDHAGYVWLGTEGEGVSRLHLNWQTFNYENMNLKNPAINYGIVEDKNGNLWIATDSQGIVKYNGEIFEPFTINSGLIGMNNVNAILVDSENWIWCATKKGVHFFDGISTLSWRSYRHKQDEPGLANDVVYDLFQDSRGDFWFATASGISHLKTADTVWTTYDTSTGIPSINIRSIWEDHLGHLWFGTIDSGAFLFADDSVYAIYNEANGLLDNHVNTIIQDNNFVYWFGSEDGICKFDGSSWEYVTRSNNDFQHDHIKCLLRDNKDNIWAGSSDGGLSKFDGKYWWDFSDCLENDQVNALIQKSDDNFWIGAHDVLIKYIPDKMAPQTFLQPITEYGAIDSTIGVAAAVFAFNGFDIETPKETIAYACSLWHAEGINTQPWSEFSRSTFFEVGPLTNGSYLFFVKAKDAENNEDPSPASFKFKVDITPPTTIINSPANDDIISGEIAIIGSAFDNSPINDFLKYELFYASGDFLENVTSDDWVLINQSFTPQRNDTLAVWDTRLLYGVYSIKLSAIDSLGHASEYKARISIVESLEDIYATSGGFMQGAQNRLQLYIPPGALQKDARIYARPVAIPAVTLPQIKFSNLAYSIGVESNADILHFQKPATLTLFFNDFDVINLNAQNLSILYFESSEDYQILGGTLDLSNSTIRTSIKELGTYILIEDNTIKSGELILSEITCQPRIFSPRQQSANISFNLSIDAKISIKIYNLAGRLVRVILQNEFTRAGYNPLEWDGRDYNGDICPSDLYVITIECEKGVKTKTVMILDKIN